MLSMAQVLVLFVVLVLLVPALRSQAQDHFTVDPQNVTAFVGTSVRLHTEFSNAAVYPYWEVLDSGSWHAIFANTSFNGQYWIDPMNGDLYIPVLKECHAGVYHGAAAIGLTFVYSNTATIAVLRTPLLQLCNNQTVCIDSSLTSASVCVITDRNPGVDWALYMLVGQTLVATAVQVTLQPYVAVHSFTCQDPVNQTTPSNISLTNSSLLASGQYVLVAKDAYGNRSVSFNISAAGPEAPQINNIPNLIAQNYSQPVSIPCFAQPGAVQSVGCGGLDVSSGLTAVWTKGGAVVPQNPSLPVYTINTLNGSTLVFTSLQSSQTGQYTCKATNSKGTATASTTVYGPPDPVSDLLSSVNQGVVTFSWTPPTPGPFVISYSLYYGIVGGNVKTEIDNITPGAVVSISQLGTYEAYMVTFGKLSSVILKSSASNYVQFTIQSSSGPSPVVIGASLGTATFVILLVAMVVLLLLAMVWCNRLKQNSQAQTWTLERDTNPTSNTYCVPPLVISSNDNNTLPDSRISTEYEVDPKWEFPPDLLQLSEILYDGFSTVLYKGTANGIKSDKAIDVAVKCCKDHASDDDLRALIADMEQLASLGSHPNIIGLLRVCTVESPVSMVVEYMCHGDLLGFLRASRGHHGMYTVFPGKREQLPSLNLTSRDLINIATKIASGMTFLAERKVVHGSLCARNVLVGTSLDIKINVGAYDLNRDSLLKWMAPETLFDGTSTTYSDVWSFGVTMWELVTLGGTPYAEILPSDLYPQLLGGMRMPKPMHCAQEVYDIIRLCWEKLPMDRLSFATLHERLDTLSHSKVSFLDLQQYSNEDYSQFEDSSTQVSTVL